MIPQATPLYVVTVGEIDGDPVVTNELVVGWEPRSGGYKPVTVAIEGSSFSGMARPLSEAHEWEDGVFRFRGRYYATAPGTVQDACRHEDLDDPDRDFCRLCGVHRGEI